MLVAVAREVHAGVVVVEAGTGRSGSAMSAGATQRLRWCGPVEAAWQAVFRRRWRMVLAGGHPLCSVLRRATRAVLWQAVGPSAEGRGGVGERHDGVAVDGDVSLRATRMVLWLAREPLDKRVTAAAWVCVTSVAVVRCDGWRASAVGRHQTPRHCVGAVVCRGSGASVGGTAV